MQTRLIVNSLGRAQGLGSFEVEQESLELRTFGRDAKKRLPSLNPSEISVAHSEP